MRALHPHPAVAAPDIGIEAEARRLEAHRLALSFVVIGDVEALTLPVPRPARRADGLWQHTCFEAFVRLPDDPGYCELNLSPSGEWAAYRFSSHRTGMVEADVPAPHIAIEVADGRFTVDAHIDLGGVLEDATARWTLGLSAVIETRDGNRSFWALAHPPGDPDFHHRDCFALELPPPTGA